MKIFVCEYITGGGLCRDALPNGLLKEGRLMRDALLTELSEIDGLELSTTCDQRANPPNITAIRFIENHEDIWQVWQSMIKDSDAVFLIAPESSGVLLRLTQMVEQQGKLLLGCSAEAVAITSSKLATVEMLQAAGIATVASYSARDWMARDQLARAELISTGGWVIKPDDDVGCEDTLHLHDHPEIRDFLAQGREDTHILQPYCEEKPASLSMLCAAGQAWLLSCNGQKVSENAGQLSYEGGVINAYAEHWQLLSNLAQSIAQAIPGLYGYIGVDIMLTEGDMPVVKVLEINPRLTTSYVGLNAATGHNIAELILELSRKSSVDDAFILPNIHRNIVEITL